MTGKICAAAALLTGLWAGSAQAALFISTAATSNVSCTGGVCTATAANAVLNAHDLEVSLAHGDTTLASGSTAQDIEFDTPVHWTSAHRLTLDSYHAITFAQPVTSLGTGGITIKTNDGGTGGDIYFADKGRVVFWDTSSSLIIRGASYTLVANIATLASDITANPSGNYALANNYDASADGVYLQEPVISEFAGTFEGLGNTISHLRINGCCGGLFAALGPNGILRDIVIAGPILHVRQGGTLVGQSLGAVIGASTVGGLISGGSGPYTNVGGLVGFLDSAGSYTGAVIRSHSSTRVSCKNSCSVGGLVGGTYWGKIRQSSATGSVTAGDHANAGGLLGSNAGETALIAFSFATGPVSVGNGVNGSDTKVVATAGGLIGYNVGQIVQSYATGAVSGGSGLQDASNHVLVGGLAGWDDYEPNYNSRITQSYASGSVSVGSQGYAGGFAGMAATQPTSQCYSTGTVSTTGASEVGGFVGFETSSRGHANPYDDWDLDTSGISDPSKGAGNKANDPGITGLTTAQFQSGLPTGFDPTIWGESPGINNGLPYLLALVP